MQLYLAAGEGATGWASNCDRTVDEIAASLGLPHPTVLALRDSQRHTLGREHDADLFRVLESAAQRLSEGSNLTLVDTAPPDSSVAAPIAEWLAGRARERRAADDALAANA
eukprot:scaffold100148_cov83-Phaeocystis_antarctica.AAC.1